MSGQRLLVRPRLWGSPVWARGNSFAHAGRAQMRRLIRDGGNVPAAARHVVFESPQVCERRVMERDRVAALALAVLSNWGHASAHQIAEFAGLAPGAVRGVLFDMLGAGWVRFGRGGWLGDRWPVAEFWSLDGGRDVGWLFERWPAVTLFEVFGGRPLTAVSSGQSARHDLFALDVALEVCVRGVGVETVAGPGEVLPAAAVGVVGDESLSSPGSMMDVLVVDSSGRSVFVELGLATDGGLKRMMFYADLVARVGADRMRVVFLSAQYPGEDRRSNAPEREFRRLLQSRPLEVARLLEVFRFADVGDWLLADGGFAGGLPARRAVSGLVDVFEVGDVLSVGLGRVPGWVGVHRGLESSHWLLSRSGDGGLVWSDWLDGVVGPTGSASVPL